MRMEPIFKSSHLYVMYTLHSVKFILCNIFCILVFWLQPITWLQVWNFLPVVSMLVEEISGLGPFHSLDFQMGKAYSVYPSEKIEKAWGQLWFHTCGWNSAGSRRKRQGPPGYIDVDFSCLELMLRVREWGSGKEAYNCICSRTWCRQRKHGPWFFFLSACLPFPSFGGSVFNLYQLINSKLLLNKAGSGLELPYLVDKELILS